MRARRWTSGAMAAACLLSLAGCRQGEVLGDESAYVLVGADTGDSGAGVGFAGRVALVGHFVGLDHTLVVWPPGTRIASGDPVALTVPGLGHLAIGDHVEGGGLSRSRSKPPDGLRIPDDCSAGALFSFWPNH